MIDREEQQATLLERFTAALCADPASAPPEELDPAMAATVARITHVLRPPEPDAVFAHQLRTRLHAAARTAGEPVLNRDPSPLRGHRNGAPPSQTIRLVILRRPSPRRRWVPVDRWPLVAAVLLGLLVTFSWTGRPRAVDALEVVQRAQSVDRSPVAGRITSFDVTTRITARSGAGAFVIGGWPSDVLFQALPQGANPGEPVQTELRQWFMAPDQLRAEAVSITPAGKTETVYISTGNDAWLYQAGPNVPILTRTGPAGTLEEQAAGVVRYVPLIAGPVLPSRPDGERCAVPKLTSDTERVAGRSVYHVTLDLDGAVCSAVPAPPGVGRMEWWIDREHFFILKTVDYSAADGQPLVSTEVTSVRFNIPIAPERFLFTLPRGVDVREEGLPAPPLFPGGGRDGPSLPANSRPPPSPSADTAPPDQ